MYCLYGEVAQLARAFGSYPKGHVFESHLRYQYKIRPNSLYQMNIGYFILPKILCFIYTTKYILAEFVRQVHIVIKEIISSN